MESSILFQYAWYKCEPWSYDAIPCLGYYYHINTWRYLAIPQQLLFLGNAIFVIFVTTSQYVLLFTVDCAGVNSLKILAKNQSVNSCGVVYTSAGVHQVPLTADYSPSWVQSLHWTHLFLTLEPSSLNKSPSWAQSPPWAHIFIFFNFLIFYFWNLFDASFCFRSFYIHAHSNSVPALACQCIFICHVFYYSWVN